MFLLLTSKATCKRQKASRRSTRAAWGEVMMIYNLISLFFFILTSLFNTCNIKYNMSVSSSAHPLLCALAVFRNILNKELIRSVHGYRDGGGGEMVRLRWVEREFVFSPTSCIEIRADPMIILLVDDHKFLQGEKLGIWLCVLAFDSAANPSSSSSSIPSILCFSRNPLLKSIPTLANDLQKVYLLMPRTDDDNPVHFSLKETCAENEEGPSLSRVLDSSSSEDQFTDSCAPVEPQVGENQPNDQLVPESGLSLKKRRATTGRVASISLSDIAKYFNLPIAEASRNLKVGLTVLKRKCREFGIHRWPHRKIKSLDTLIRNLQEEVSRQRKDNEAAAVKAAARRQQMLESEKEGIERSPFVELQRETKRFRQDVFKRRHKAKALSKMSQPPFSSRSSSL